MVDTKDRRFSIGWVVAGTVIMFGLSFLGGVVAGAAKLSGLWPLFGVAEICFFVGGLIVGRQSRGSTILEAGLAAVLALVISNLIQGTHLSRDPRVYAIGYGIPFVTALLGAWIGEMLQGDA